MRRLLSLLPLLLSSPAVAADDASLQARLFGHALGKEPAYACFTRDYAPDHLASHPKQNVTAITLMVKGTNDGGAQYSAGLDFHFRKSGNHFMAFGECPSLAVDPTNANPNFLHCAVDCDGGSINVDLKGDGTILVKLPAGIAVADAKGADPGKKGFGADDSVFKLSRAPGASCLALAQDDAEKAALKALK